MYGRPGPPDSVHEETGQRSGRARAEDALTVGELEDARLGFFRLLSRRFGAEFKERHGEEIFAQAAYEFSRALDRGAEIWSPTAWIIDCAWKRTIDEVNAQKRRPRSVPTDSLPTEPIAGPSWQPEDTFLTEDRMRKIREAVDQLPAYQRELIARHYFEEESVREASRRMGWSAGKGARAHNSARRRLREIFADVSSSDLKFEVGLASFLSLSAVARRAAADVPAGVETALDRIGHGVSDAWHDAVRLVRHPLGGGRPGDLATSDPDSPGRISQLGRRIVGSPATETLAAAGDGAGRVAEVCKAGLAICAIGGGALTVGVIHHGGDAGHHGSTAVGRQVSRRTSGSSRSTQRDVRAAVETSQVGGPGTDETEPLQSSAQSPAPHGRGSGSVEHSIAASKTAGSSSAGGQLAAGVEDVAEEESAARESFGAFDGRGEVTSTGSGSSTADAQSLSGAEDPPDDAPSSDPDKPSSTPPKVSAERQAAGEQFGGALR